MERDMFSRAGEAFAKLSKENVRMNLEFTKNMKLNGEKMEIPCRSGMREAVIHRSKNFCVC